MNSSGCWRLRQRHAWNGPSLYACIHPSVLRGFMHVQHTQTLYSGTVFTVYRKWRVWVPVACACCIVNEVNWTENRKATWHQIYVHIAYIHVFICIYENKKPWPIIASVVGMALESIRVHGGRRAKLKCILYCFGFIERWYILLIFVVVFHRSDVCSCCVTRCQWWTIAKFLFFLGCPRQRDGASRA